MHSLLSASLAIMAAAGTPWAAPAAPEQSAAAAPEAPRRPSGRVGRDAAAFVSEARLFAVLEELTSIRSFAGWRNSAARGESEAIDLVAARLRSMATLSAWGLELERRSFRTFSATEFHTTAIEITAGGVSTALPAFGITGHRDSLAHAMAFDSDGLLNDSDPDPVTVRGRPVLVRSDADLTALPSRRLVVVDYAWIDRTVVDPDIATDRARAILEHDPQGIVCVTRFSNEIGVSHGTFAGDLPVWSRFAAPLPPILNLRLEDAAAAGFHDLADLALVDELAMTWDMDVHAPGSSEYLMARIPGSDSSRALIVSAHIDSSNTPGAIDDGAGVVSVLEVAAAIAEARTPPAVDVHLVLYGGHERGMYGSSAFVADHQELLDRTIAVLQIDCLSVPLDGLDMYLNLETWPWGRFGDTRLTWPDYLAALAADRDIYVNPLGYYGIVSDSTNYTAWNVPNANLIFMDPYSPVEVHYAGHMHDPYDDVDLARREAATVVNMATVAAAAAMAAGRDDPGLRVTPTPDRRVVAVASHTESAHMTPTHFIDLGMALAWSGLDLDMVPYGTPVTAPDLEDAAMVVVLPVHDYPCSDGDVDLYDEEFSADELDALESYARSGGLLVVTNSAHRLKYANLVYEDNEDWVDMNDLAGRFGVQFTADPLDTSVVGLTRFHPLVDGLATLAGAPGNGVSITHDGGRVLGRVSGRTAILLRSADAGEVLVLADLGLLGNDGGDPENLPFWENLAAYARSR